MSDRSKAWYAVPGNAERRRLKMRLYGRALVILGRRYPDVRRAEYQAAISDGLLPTVAQNRANKCLREAHAEEFRQIYSELLEGSADGSP